MRKELLSYLYNKVFDSNKLTSNQNDRNLGIKYKCIKYNIITKNLNNKDMELNSSYE